MSGTTEGEIDRYLRTGDCDPYNAMWPGKDLIDRASHAHESLRAALVSAVKDRTGHAIEPEVLRGLDLVAFARAKATPMVQGLFPRAEQGAVLQLLERSVVFLTPSNIESILSEMNWHETAWDLANLYLTSVGAAPLSVDTPGLVGLSEETTCFVSMDYFGPTGRFEDFIVHEMAHVFHNWKRGSIGLRQTRRREWLLSIAFGKREVFAYACEAYSRILEHALDRAGRLLLLEELRNEAPMPDPDRVDFDEYLQVLSEAVSFRNGWKRILARCSSDQPTRTQ